MVFQVLVFLHLADLLVLLILHVPVYFVLMSLFNAEKIKRTPGRWFERLAETLVCKPTIYAITYDKCVIHKYKFILA
ncbi:MAG: hypothetical protein CM15mP116_10620 [Synechococcus sp.]|nr:MAG: hypothetical protein CM15mP116_10620 [Synechococcus sp.]